jgi:hypothetical protein
MERRLVARFPLLLRETERVWRAEVEAFLDFDLRRLLADGHRLESLEEVWEHEVPLGPGRSLPSRGIPDRVTRGPDGRLRVSDYKTTRRSEGWVKPEEIVTARRVQLPLYILMASARAPRAGIDAEFLGLGPGFLPDGGAARSGPVALDASLAGMREGLEETLGVLRDLVERGRFPFRSGRHCDGCDFDRACRRHHHPSRRRVETHPEAFDYFRTERKTKTRPLLAQVPVAEDEEEEGE